MTQVSLIIFYTDYIVRIKPVQQLKHCNRAAYNGFHWGYNIAYYWYLWLQRSRERGRPKKRRMLSWSNENHSIAADYVLRFHEVQSLGKTTELQGTDVGLRLTWKIRWCAHYRSTESAARRWHMLQLRAISNNIRDRYVDSKNAVYVDTPNDHIASQSTVLVVTRQSRRLVMFVLCNSAGELLICLQAPRDSKKEFDN